MVFKTLLYILLPNPDHPITITYIYIRVIVELRVLWLLCLNIETPALT